MKNFCTPYPDELQLSMGLANSLQLSMSTKCTIKQTRRHRESTRKHVQGTRAQMARASTTHELAGMGYLPRQTGWQTHKQRQGSHTQVQSTRTKKMRCKHPGNGTGRVAFAVPCHDCCASSIILSMAGLPWVFLGASGLVREVVHMQGAAVDSCNAPFPTWLGLRATPSPPSWANRRER